MFVLCCSLAVALAAGASARAPQVPGSQPPPAAKPSVQGQEPKVRETPRVRAEASIRLGGVYTLGLGAGSAPLADSAALGTPLSEENRRWIATHLDVIALDARNLQPDTFPSILKQNRLFTPLLSIYASSLYEQEDHRGNAGGWSHNAAKWTLRGASDQEVPHPDAGGHWMDFASAEWAAHWRDAVVRRLQKFGAYGVAVAELPLNNTFVQTPLARYKTATDRMEATSSWLRAARSQFLIVPSAVGFDSPVGRPTVPLPSEREQPELRGRIWDEMYPVTDGAWAEGWLRPYWLKSWLPEKIREIQMEAADRASLFDQVFIAACAYRDDAELEFALGCYLLVLHRQGRLVFQPMPQRPGDPEDAGYSLAVLRREVQEKAAYFDVELGAALQERHRVRVEGGSVWRRRFQKGAVYVNVSDDQKVTIDLGGPLQRLSGETTRRIVLPPRSAAILRDSPEEKRPSSSLPTGAAK